MTPQSTVLYFSQGNSDKVYQAQLECAKEGCRVNFQYGRRGSALKSGTKTPAPVAYDNAKAIYDKLIKGKMAKGYTEAESGIAYQGTDKAGNVSGALPQLLNAIDRTNAAALARNDDWMAQIKHDGERRMIRLADGQVTGINRKGLTVALPEQRVTDIKALATANDCTQLLIDGEDMGGLFVAFDLLEINGEDVRPVATQERFRKLQGLFANGPYTDTLVVTSSALHTDTKSVLLDSAYTRGEEGVVFKHKHAAYQAGRPDSGGDALKLKFCASATVRVACITDGKRSVNMEVQNANGCWEPVGNVTVPVNHKVPAVGDIIEVNYLYAFRGGSLFQPVYKGPRADQDADDCTIMQLQYKGECREAA
jgi:bifunctional non-homologous end joining protein LigD